MTAVDTAGRIELDPYAPRLVDGHPDYEWYLDTLHGQHHEVYWVPQVDGIVRVGTVRRNPDRTASNQLHQFLVEDADGQWLACADTIPEAARLLVLHHRTERLAARHANAAVDTFTATADLDAGGWQRCVEFAELPVWANEFGPFGPVLSDTDGGPTIDRLLRKLGIDPDEEGRPDGPLRPCLERTYERAYDQAWHSALVATARHRLRTP